MISLTPIIDYEGYTPMPSMVEDPMTSFTPAIDSEGQTPMPSVVKDPMTSLTPIIDKEGYTPMPSVVETIFTNEAALRDYEDEHAAKASDSDTPSQVRGEQPMSNPYETTSPSSDDREQVTTPSTYDVPRPQPPNLGNRGNMNTANTSAQKHVSEHIPGKED